MNFELNPEDHAFRDETREFLDRYLTPEIRKEAARDAGVWANFELAMRWQKILHTHGRAAPSWPVEHGGTDWSLVQHYIWNSECALAAAPRVPAMGLKMCGPVIMKYGTQAQKSQFLPRMLSGEDFWCQGYSEPGAGSDLAALQCRAETDGDDFIINGTKIWTTYAQHANWIFCLVRTAKGERPQQGISFLLIPMDLEGISVTPIISISGDHEVNQVFFENVRVPKANLLGEENEGWAVAKYLLAHERGGSFAAGLKRQIKTIKAIASAEVSGGSPLIENHGFARKLARTEIELNAVDMTEQRIIAKISTGEASPADPSFLKLRGTEMAQMIDELAVEAIGAYAAPDFLSSREGRSNWAPGPDYAVPIVGKYLNNRASTIYGGSSEVQRNIMSKVLFAL